MAGAMLTLLLAALDNTIVSTAMPKIIRDLHGMEHYAWPFTAYMLCSTIVLPVSGKLADIAVLSRDVTACDPEEILSTEVLRTYVDGRLVFEA